MIKAEWVGDQAVIARFEELSPALQTRAVEAITRLSLKLQRDVQTDKLSGQVLKLKTGTLRRSIDWKVNQANGQITGKVSTNVKYGIAHEFGFSGVVDVKAHLRTITQAFGKSITPKTVEVRAHPMKMNLPERSFLRSALRDLMARGEFESEINRAIDLAIKDSE
jgi:phage gpG-like protein